MAMSPKLSPLRIRVVAMRLAIAVVAASLSGCPKDTDVAEFGGNGSAGDSGSLLDISGGDSGAVDAATTTDIGAANDVKSASDAVAAGKDASAAQDTASAVVDTGSEADAGSPFDIGPKDAGPKDVGASKKCKSPTDCDDGNPCTADGCNPAATGATKKGCIHDAISASCSGSPCTVGDKCVAGACVAGQGKLFVKAYPEFGHIDAIGPAIPVQGGGISTVLSTYDKQTGARWGWYLRTDETGKIVLKSTVLSTAWNGLYDLAPVPTGGLLLGGSAYTASGAYNAWLVRLGANEKQVWQKTYGGKAPCSVAESRTDGSHVFFAGHIQQNGNWSGYIGKVELATGKEVWAKPAGGLKADLLMSVRPWNGGAVAVGVSENGTLGDKDLWLLRVDGTGKPTQHLYFGGKAHDEGRQLEIYPDGSVLLFGNTQSIGKGGVDMWAMRVSAAGKLTWQTTIGGVGNDWFSQAVVDQTGASLFGSTMTGLTSPRPWLVRTGPGMVPLWNKTIDTGAESYGRALFAETSGRTTLSMWKGQGGTNTAMLARVNAWGHSTCKAAGSCATKSPKSCADSDPCTVDSCSPKGCVHHKAPDNAYCAIGKVCKAGQCKPF